MNGFGGTYARYAATAQTETRDPVPGPSGETRACAGWSCAFNDNQGNLTSGDV